MRYIDEKGKLFGKVSIIDLLVLVIILLIIGSAAYQYGPPKVKKWTGQKTEIETKDVTFTVKCTVKNEAYANSMHALDRLVSGNAFNQAHIQSVKSTPAVIAAVDSEGRPVYSTDPIKKDLLITIKMKVNAKANPIKLGADQEIYVNNSFTVKTELAVFVGVIEDVKVELE